MTTRLLHTMLRVRHLDRSLAFYCDGLGMRMLRRLDFAAPRFSLVYLGYEDDRTDSCLELTLNWDQADDYSHGTGYGHIGIGVDDLGGTCERLRAAGFGIVREPGEMAGSGIHIAFATDPDDYRIELIQLPYPPAAIGSLATFG